MKLKVSRILVIFVLMTWLVPGLYAQEDETANDTKSDVDSSLESITDLLESAGEGGFTPYEGGSGQSSEEAAEPSKGLEERISLDLRNIEVTEALRFIAMKGGLNLAISKSVSGRLLLLLNDVPIRDILDIVLITNELAYDKQGEIYNIMTETEYKTRYGRKFSDPRKVELFTLKFAVPERIFAALDALKSEIGRVLVDQESGMVLVMDTEDNLARMRRAVETQETQRGIRVFPLQYAKARDIEERLKSQLDSKSAGTVIADETSNQVVVQTFPERMEAIAKLIKALDQKTKEVLIVAKIIKVTISDNLDAEFKWEGFFQTNQLGDSSNDASTFLSSHVFKVLDRTGASAFDDFVSIAPTTRPTTNVSKNTFTENLILGQLGEDKFEVLLNFLRTLGETKVLSSPRITVTNNQEAKIHVGERQAYVTTTTTTGTSSNTVAEQVTFIDIGIQLSVTPTINDDGFVTMSIKPEISSVTSTLTTQSGNKIPIVDTSEAQTTVMVKDRTSVVIAGLRRDDLVVSDKRVPYLGDIPYLGNMFRSQTKDKQRAELLVLLTPYIVDGESFVTGEPLPASESMKGYREYPALAKESAEHPGVAGAVA
ncbi:MAG: hypothetical protein HY587_01735 [Candidatus Omnitrophica bacterium]|nr:hypothetical protein [Candidatus Omnitrophota bacterium]